MRPQLAWAVKRRFGLVVVLRPACGHVDFTPLTTGSGLVTYRDAVLADSPIAYWTLDDVGTTARDELGAFDGVYTGTCMQQVARALTDDPSPAVHFDGVSCGITVADEGRLQFLDAAPFSLEAWISPETEINNGYFDVVGRQVRSGGSPDASPPPCIWSRGQVRPGRSSTTSRRPTPTPATRWRRRGSTRQLGEHVVGRVQRVRHRDRTRM